MRVKPWEAFRWMTAPPAVPDRWVLYKRHPRDQSDLSAGVPLPRLVRHGGFYSTYRFLLNRKQDGADLRRQVEKHPPTFSSEIQRPASLTSFELLFCFYATSQKAGPLVWSLDHVVCLYGQCVKCSQQIKTLKNDNWSMKEIPLLTSNIESNHNPLLVTVFFLMSTFISLAVMSQIYIRGAISGAESVKDRCENQKLPTSVLNRCV